MFGMGTLDRHALEVEKVDDNGSEGGMGMTRKPKGEPQ